MTALDSCHYVFVKYCLIFLNVLVLGGGKLETGKTLLRILFRPTFFILGSCYVAQATLKVMILLLLPSECWEYRRVSLYPDSSLTF
jgi:hypothetical protein